MGAIAGGSSHEGVVIGATGTLGKAIVMRARQARGIRGHEAGNQVDIEDSRRSTSCSRTSKRSTLR